jgi:fumarate reductase subunit D
MSPLDRLLVAVVLLSALWWACSRHRLPSALHRLSAIAPAIAVATALFDDGPRWQMVP